MGNRSRTRSRKYFRSYYKAHITCYYFNWFGNSCDAQFLFAEDILGQSKISFPRHAKKYKNFDKILSDIQKERIDAFKKYKTEVQKINFLQKTYYFN